ncbi:hypothetical protein HOG48_00060 [Candidatus Peregrinibacteria bacterium]|jgi:hypothetical protein|nr:hypothetical protein [Candidatus Peregrinibacteria bacterium]
MGLDVKRAFAAITERNFSDQERIPEHVFNILEIISENRRSLKRIAANLKINKKEHGRVTNTGAPINELVRGVVSAGIIDGNIQMFDANDNPVEVTDKLARKLKRKARIWVELSSNGKETFQITEQGRGRLAQLLADGRNSKPSTEDLLSRTSTMEKALMGLLASGLGASLILGVLATIFGVIYEDEITNYIEGTEDDPIVEVSDPIQEALDESTPNPDTILVPASEQGLPAPISEPTPAPAPKQQPTPTPKLPTRAPVFPPQCEFLLIEPGMTMALCMDTLSGPIQADQMLTNTGVTNNDFTTSGNQPVRILNVQGEVALCSPPPDNLCNAFEPTGDVADIDRTDGGMDTVTVYKNVTDQHPVR